MKGRSVFTRSQREILGLMVAGKRTKEIAAELGIRPCSVAQCCARMCERVGARSNIQLVAIAYQRGEVR